MLLSRVAIIVETLTDNKNRTASNIRTIFQKSGGSLGTSGSAAHNFIQKGVIRFKSNDFNENEVYNFVVDLGVEECFFANNLYEVHCNKNQIFEIKKKLEKKIDLFFSYTLEWIPYNYIELDVEKKDLILKLVETLEDDDDIQNVFTNLKKY